MSEEMRDVRAFEVAFDEERLARARALSLVRFVIVIAVFFVHLAFGYGLQDPNWQGNTDIYAGYAVLAGLVLWTSRHRDRWARLSSLAIPFVDMPAVLFLQLAALPTNDDPTGLVGFAVGAFIFVLVLGALTFEDLLLLVSAVVAFGCQAVLLSAVGSDLGGYAIAGLFVGGTAAVLFFANHRLGTLIYTVTVERMRQARLTEINRAKDQFVATVSHDFRSPLAIITASAQTVLDDTEMPQPVQAKFLATIVRQCRRLQALVNDLLDLARIENRAACREEICIDELAAEVVEGNREAFAEKGVELTFAPERDVPVCARADRGLLGQAFGNLLVNALKFTPEGGAVEVRCERAGRDLHFSVSDTGIGIPESEQPRLFERFFQGQGGATRGDGSGLGLAIVAEIARKHDGEVVVQSAPGKGSTFTFRFPSAAGSDHEGSGD